jgi:hypothetical protein
MFGFKQKVHQECVSMLTDRIAAAKKAMEDAQESANSDDKNSAGDKFETGRAMGQLDRNMFARQFAKAQDDLNKLRNIKYDYLITKIGNGALIKTEKGLFYVAVGLGNLKVDGKLVTVISNAAPIMQEMAGKQAGETYSLNNTEVEIEDVW